MRVFVEGRENALSLFDRHGPVNASVRKIDLVKCSRDNIQGAGPKGKDYAEDVRHSRCVHRHRESTELPFIHFW